MKTMTLSLFLLSLILSSCSDDGSVVDPDSCQGVACSGHGECVVGEEGAVCECDTDYHAEGLSCVEDGTTGPCYQIDCSGHGVCVDVNGAPSCVCDEGFHEVELSCIEDSVDSCEGVTCSGHGQCVEHGGVAECDCDDGYHADGLNCVENAVDPCIGVTCSGHGQCVANGGVAECDCDEGYEAEGLGCLETLCSCRERTKVDISSCQYAERCTTAADCCPDAGSIAPLICNEDDPYRYACNAGVCETQSCESDEHCLANFSVVQQNSPGVWVNEGCVTADCPPHARWCSYRETCNSAADCCPEANSIAPYVCQVDYPYVYGCEEGLCRMIFCTGDAQCQRVGESYDPADDWAHLGCVENIDPCTGQRGYGLCTFKKTCTTYQDCCQENMGAFTCGADFPFLYECIDNLCENPWCSEDGQCDVFFEQLDDANPGRYVGLGCVEF